MTGIRPSTSGVYANHEPLTESPVLARATTLPAHFKAHGYRTLGAGKIYHGACPDPEAWDDYWPSKTQIRPEDPLPEGRPLNGIPGTRHFDWGPVAVSEEQMGDWQVAQRIAGHLASAGSEPFFMACGFFRPHLPWYVPGEYFDRHPLENIVLPEVRADDLEDVPEFARRIARPSGDHVRVTGYAQWRAAVRGYLASISFMDDCLGKVIAALERSPHPENTIVVLWADHGWHLGEKLHWRKFALWEEATRNVLVIRAPGNRNNGRSSDAPVNLLDIYPTLTEMCGLQPVAAHEGRSLVPLLANPGAGRDRPSLTTYGRGNHSLRSRRWRFIRYNDNSEELYDHRSDPNEWSNLAGDTRYTDVCANLRRWLPANDAVPVSEAIGRNSINESIRSREP
jgi:arylsulfatase A-like enzyme